MPFFFTPPVRFEGATTLVNAHPGNILMRNFPANRVGINVFLMPGNIVTEVEPYSDLEAIRVFHGAHIHPIDDTEYALLVAAGYVDNIIEVGAPAVLPPIDAETPDGYGPTPPLPIVEPIDIYIDGYEGFYGSYFPGGIPDEVAPFYEEFYT